MEPYADTGVPAAVLATDYDAMSVKEAAQAGIGPLGTKLGDPMREARYFAAGGIVMNKALLRRTHNHGLGFLQGCKCLDAIACGNGFLNVANAAAHFGAAAFVDCSAPRDLSGSFAGRIGIGHAVLVSPGS